MSLRIRKSGRVLCAAMHEEEQGDFYLNDAEHYKLSVEVGVLVTEPFEKHVETGHGEWWWRHCVPEGVEIDPFYLTKEGK